MLKILQARLQQYVNRELPDVQAGFRKGSGTRDQIVNIRWITEKAREFQKNIYFCFNDSTQDFDCVEHSKLWKILQEMGISDHLTCLLRNLYSGQETTVRTRNGKTQRNFLANPTPGTSLVLLSPFMEEETEALRDSMIRPKSRSQLVTESGVTSVSCLHSSCSYPDHQTLLPFICFVSILSRQTRLPVSPLCLS